MIEVTKFTNQQFTSNVFKITSSSNIEEVILIDCGEFDEVSESLTCSKRLINVFITHYHYDHIYYIQKYIDKYPNVKFYGSLLTLEGLSNSKQNLSFYHNDSVEISKLNYQVLSDGQILPFFNRKTLKALETEGHCEGSFTFIIDDFIFTGDALIPNIPVVTKLKTGNKIKAKESVEKIKASANKNSIICPGHLAITKYKNVDWDSYLSNL